MILTAIFCGFAWAREGVRGRQLVEELGCAGCHSDLNAPVIHRLPLGAYRPAFLFAYLKNPVKIRSNIGAARMPDFYFDDEEALALTRFLTAPERMGGDTATAGSPLDQFYRQQGSDRVAELAAAYRSAQALLPDPSPEMGRKIFASQNCIACHNGVDVVPFRESLAPPLRDLVRRTRPEWLRFFLKRPQPIRPFGYIPGTGSRMPDFRLSDAEVQQLIGYFAAQKRGASWSATPEAAKNRSPFAMKKAAQLMKEKLSCMGCHRMGGIGGRIGPDLSDVSRRRPAEYIRAMVEDPTAVHPGGVMPKIPMPPEWRELIIDYLQQIGPQPTEHRYLSLTAHPLLLPSPGPPVAVTYQKYCAPCHGAEGNGGGFNARYLFAAPTVHQNGAYMATRTDEALYAGVASGGYILNRSQLMPPWREHLSSSEIAALVKYMRKLCQCRGPDWSRDQR